LKPTVGIELEPVSTGPDYDGARGCAKQWHRDTDETRRRRLAQLGTDVDLLDSKLSSLERMGQLAFIKVDDVDAGGSFRIRKILTARTLNSEVLPAFCNPIMVMSISVALDGIAG